MLLKDLEVGDQFRFKIGSGHVYIVKSKQYKLTFDMRYELVSVYALGQYGHYIYFNEQSYRYREVEIVMQHINLFEAWEAITNGKVVAVYNDILQIIAYYKRDNKDRLAYLGPNNSEWKTGLVEGFYLTANNKFSIVDDPVCKPRKFTVDEVTKVEQYKITKENAAAAFNIVREAHDEAIEKYPWWPINVYVGNSIIAEEFGEAVMASLDLKFKNHPLKDLLKEHGQAAAMHVRQLQHLLNVVETMNGDSGSGKLD